jgi:hypothetical protein
MHCFICQLPFCHFIPKYIEEKNHLKLASCIRDECSHYMSYITLFKPDNMGTRRYIFNTSPNYIADREHRNICLSCAKLLNLKIDSNEEVVEIIDKDRAKDPYKSYDQEFDFYEFGLVFLTSSGYDQLDKEEELDELNYEVVLWFPSEEEVNPMVKCGFYSLQDEKNKCENQVLSSKGICKSCKEKVVKMGLSYFCDKYDSYIKGKKQLYISCEKGEIEKYRNGDLKVNLN